MYRNANNGLPPHLEMVLMLKFIRTENIMIGSIQYGNPMLKSTTSSPPFNGISPPSAGQGMGVTLRNGS